ncbi:MAG: hypothetical protein MAG581_01666 [Deltaproteobacteria bacterium]|nr:hypothetical protein [Deltaproteobacteria bacterium]
MVDPEGKASGLAISLLNVHKGNPTRRRVRVVLARLKSWPIIDQGSS